MNSFYTDNELKNIGLKSYGRNVLISRKTSIYDASKISIGDNVRIDDFCILSGQIILGSNIHISAFCAIYARFTVEIEDFSGLSPRCTLFSAIDDFSGNYLIGPMVPQKYTNVIGGEISIKKYSQIGAGCIILPNIIINEGCAVGAMSLINRTLDCWGIYAGIPVKRIRDRSKNMLMFVGEIGENGPAS